MEPFVIQLDLTELQNSIRKIVIETMREAMPVSKEPVRPELLTRRQAKDELHVSYPTLNRYNKEGILKAQKIGGRVLYLWSDVEQALSLGDNIKHQRSNNSSLYR